MIGRFDDCCPHCSQHIDDINRRFGDRDYSTDFTFDCPYCKRSIQCDVHMVPEFQLSKAQTPEEYQAFLKSLMATAELCPGCCRKFVPNDSGRSLCISCTRERGE